MPRKAIARDANSMTSADLAELGIMLHEIAELLASFPVRPERASTAD